MDKLGRIKCDAKAAEMLFELQVEAFVEGLSDFEPNYKEYGISHQVASEIVGRVVLGLNTPSQAN